MRDGVHKIADSDGRSEEIESRIALLLAVSDCIYDRPDSGTTRTLRSPSSAFFPFTFFLILFPHYNKSGGGAAVTGKCYFAFAFSDIYYST